MTSAAPSTVISTRVAPETKAALAALAARLHLSESLLLRQLVEEVSKSNAGANSQLSAPVCEGGGRLSALASDRITLRLRPRDRALAAERACARGMKTGSYLALLIHNHVREAAVHPPHELDAIKAVAARLAGLSRQLRMFGMPNGCMTAAGSDLRDLIAQIRPEVESAREVVADIVRRNLISWEDRHA